MLTDQLYTVLKEMHTKMERKNKQIGMDYTRKITGMLTKEERYQYTKKPFKIERIEFS